MSDISQLDEAATEVLPSLTAGVLAKARGMSAAPSWEIFRSCPTKLDYSGQD